MRSKLFVVVGAALVGLGVVAAVRFGLREYHAAQVVKRCNTLRPGMTRDQVLAIMGETPHEARFLWQGNKKTRLAFSARWAASTFPSCVIDDGTEQVDEVTCDDTHQGQPQTNFGILKTELAALNVDHPVADMEKNFAGGDKRFIGIYGYALSCPGVPDEAHDLTVTHGIKPIHGTSDALESPEYAALQEKAMSYARTYNQALLKKFGR